MPVAGSAQARYETVFSWLEDYSTICEASPSRSFAGSTCWQMAR